MRRFQKNNRPARSRWIAKSSGFGAYEAWIWQSKPSHVGQFNFWNSLNQELVHLEQRADSQLLESIETDRLRKVKDANFANEKSVVDE